MILSCLTCQLGYIWCLWTYCLVSERLNLKFSAEERKGYVPVHAECGDGRGELSSISKYFQQILSFSAYSVPSPYEWQHQFVLILFFCSLNCLISSNFVAIFSTVVSCPASFLVWEGYITFKNFWLLPNCGFSNRLLNGVHCRADSHTFMDLVNTILLTP